MSRMDQLLDQAAQALEDGTDPFNASWLAENDVTFDECMTLGETMALAIRVYRQVMRMGLSDNWTSRRLASTLHEEERQSQTKTQPRNRYPTSGAGRMPLAQARG